MVLIVSLWLSIIYMESLVYTKYSLIEINGGGNDSRMFTFSHNGAPAIRTGQLVCVMHASSSLELIGENSLSWHYSLFLITI